MNECKVKLMKLNFNDFFWFRHHQCGWVIVYIIARHRGHRLRQRSWKHGAIAQLTPDMHKSSLLCGWLLAGCLSFVLSLAPAGLFALAHSHLICDRSWQVVASCLSIWLVQRSAADRYRPLLWLLCHAFDYLCVYVWVCVWRIFACKPEDRLTDRYAISWHLMDAGGVMQYAYGEMKDRW